MTARDDDLDEWEEGAMLRGIDDTADDAALRDVLTLMRGLASGPAPAPSPELAALLAGEGVTPVAARRAQHPQRWAGLAAAAVIAMFTALAATHTLPTPAQRFVSDVVDRFTPFDIAPPHPATRPTPQQLTPTPHPSRPTSRPPRSSATPPVAPPSVTRRPAPQPDPSSDGGAGRTDDGTGRTTDGGTGGTDDGSGERTGTTGPVTAPSPVEPGDDGATSGGAPAPSPTSTRPPGTDDGGGGDSRTGGDD